MEGFMFVINLVYKKPLEIVEGYVVEHRLFLDEGYKKNFFIMSGPKNPRTGGIIISQLKDRVQLEKILQQDPFNIHGIADYEIIEFNPIKYLPDMACFV
jgi:uncharacterized protein YciI